MLPHVCFFPFPHISIVFLCTEHPLFTFEKATTETKNKDWGSTMQTLKPTWHSNSIFYYIFWSLIRVIRFSVGLSILLSPCEVIKWPLTNGTLLRQMKKSGEGMVDKCYLFSCVCFCLWPVCTHNLMACFPDTVQYKNAQSLRPKHEKKSYSQNATKQFCQ